MPIPLLPPELGNCSLLYHLDLSVNFFQQQIPISLLNLRNLTFLNLYGNSLNGTIPDFLFSIPNLEYLYLNDNQLSGKIPSNVGNASKLISLWFSNNLLSGTVPPSLGDCSALQELNLDANQLSGPLSKLQDLIIFDVSKNRFEGDLPFEFMNCKSTELLDVSYNLFNGSTLPATLGNCTSLREFSTISCGLAGPIPLSLGQLINLESLQVGAVTAMELLDLCNNTLSGSLDVLGSLTGLQFINVSYNRFSGPIPKNLWKYLNSSSPFSFLGNSDLCLRCSQEDDSICSSKSINKRHCHDESKNRKV